MGSNNDKTGESRESKDIWGNERTEHFDADHNKVGESRRSKDIWGDERTEHFDADHNKVGESRESKDFWGNERTEHFDADHDKAGESRESKDFWGNERTEHFDADHDKVGESRRSKDIWGDDRTEHYGDSHRSGSRAQSENSGGLEELLGKLVVGCVVIFAALWLLFSVVIPLAVINLALIALVIGLVGKSWRKFAFPLSVLGLLVLLLDYNLGWFTKTLVSSVEFFRGWIRVFLYLNLAAGLTAAYFLIRVTLVARFSSPASDADLARNKAILLGGVILTGGLIIGVQTLVDSRKAQGNVVAESQAPPQQAPPFSAPVQASPPAQAIGQPSEAVTGVSSASTGDLPVGRETQRAGGAVPATPGPASASTEPQRTTPSVPRDSARAQSAPLAAAVQPAPATAGQPSEAVTGVSSASIRDLPVGRAGNFPDAPASAPVEVLPEQSTSASSDVTPTAGGLTFEGDWTGTVQQRGVKPYVIKVSLRNTQSGSIEGVVAYPDFRCGGEWVLNAEAGETATFTERIITGQTRCATDTRISMSLSANSQATLTWHVADIAPTVMSRP